MLASELEMVFFKENYEPIQVNKDGTVQIVLQQKSDWMYIYWETAKQWQGHGFAFIHCFKSLRYQRRALSSTSVTLRIVRRLNGSFTMDFKTGMEFENGGGAWKTKYSFDGIR